MMRSNLARTIAECFDRAADRYDRAASVQAQIAENLVRIAAQRLHHAPKTILDIGCGTGFAAAAATQHWPQANITAIDGAPAMLKQAQRKIPHLRAIEGNIAERHLTPQFDLILSNMVLHWLPEPRAELEKWRQGLAPGGRIFAALLVAGSFQEWRDLCARENLTDGIWNFPAADFADDLIAEKQSLIIDYPSAKDFLDRLKATGAATARPAHKSLTINEMRHLLARAPEPFRVTYRVAYIEMPVSI